MRKILITLVSILTITISGATEKEIIVDVIFKNQTNIELISGELLIIETNKKIKVKSLKNFKLTLPKKGKYQFEFVTNDFSVFTSYPSKITKNKNRVIIYLMDKDEFNFDNKILKNMNLTIKEIEKKISNDNLNFIIHGIDGSIPIKYVDFKKKYRIGFKKENCVIDPLSFRKAARNNQIISNYLTKKYGKNWLKELPIKPFGLKKLSFQGKDG